MWVITRQIILDKEYCICERGTCQEMRRKDRLAEYELQNSGYDLPHVV